AWPSVPGAEAIVEAAGGHGWRGTVERAGSAARIFLRLGVLLRRRGFGRGCVCGFGLCGRWRGLRAGRAGGALPGLRRGGGGFRLRGGSVGGLRRARVLGLGTEKIAEETTAPARASRHRRGDLHRRTRPVRGL